jgi:hypothetical protein
MNSLGFRQQLLRDLKASAPKTAALGLLLLVGLYFWVPPLVRAFSGNSPGLAAADSTTPTLSAKTAATPASDAGTSSTTSTPATSARSTDDTTAACNSEAWNRLLKEHRFLQPANVDEFPAKPFGVNDEQFPLPVLFAEDAESAVTATKTKPIEKLDGLLLKSTIVGTRRRAAWINNRLLREGQSVSWNGHLLRLVAVNRKSVTLAEGDRQWQLTIKDGLKVEDPQTEPAKE